MRNMIRVLLEFIAILAVLASVGAANPKAAKGSCFPYGTGKLPKDFSNPNKPLEEWWCPSSMAYGFQGFSHPLGDPDCSAPSNSFAAIDRDFARMRADFGASVVRLYYPRCASEAVFERALRAGIANDMAVIFQANTEFVCGVRLSSLPLQSAGKLTNSRPCGRSLNGT